MHFRTFGAAQALHDVFGAHFYAGYGRIVDGGDAVACQDACLFGRSPADRLDDQQRVFNHLELDAYALKVAFERLAHGLGFFRVGVGGMGVKVFEHADNGVLYKLVFVDCVHIQAVDGKLGHLQFAQRQVALGCRSEGCQAKEEGKEDFFLHGGFLGLVRPAGRCSGFILH